MIRRSIAQVVVARDARRQMEWAAWDAHPREVLGLLLGEVREGSVLVTQAVVCPGARGTLGSIEAEEDWAELARDFWGERTIVGDFHSHPGGPQIASETDHETHLEEEWDAAIVVTVWPGRRRPFRTRLRAYVLVGGVVRPAKLAYA